MLKEKISSEGDPGAPNLSRCHALKTLAAPAAPSLDAPGFLQLSKALTAHASMHTAFTRLFATLSASDTSFASRAGSLVRQVREGQNPQQLLVVANASGWHDVALAIVAGFSVDKPTGPMCKASGQLRLRGIVVTDFYFSKTYLKKI
jgi:hypothetical protein